MGPQESEELGLDHLRGRLDVIELAGPEGGEHESLVLFEDEKVQGSGLLAPQTLDLVDHLQDLPMDPPESGPSAPEPLVRPGLLPEGAQAARGHRAQPRPPARAPAQDPGLVRRPLGTVAGRLAAPAAQRVDGPLHHWLARQDDLEPGAELIPETDQGLPEPAELLRAGLHGYLY